MADVEVVPAAAAEEEDDPADYEEFFPENEDGKIACNYRILHPETGGTNWEGIAKKYLSDLGYRRPDIPDALERLRKGAGKYSKMLKLKMKHPIRDYYVERARDLGARLMSGQLVRNFKDLQQKWKEDDRDENYEEMWNITEGEKAVDPNWCGKIVVAAMEECNLVYSGVEDVMEHNRNIAGQHRGVPLKGGGHKIATDVGTKERNTIFRSGKNHHGRNFGLRDMSDDKEGKKGRKNANLNGKFPKDLLGFYKMTDERKKYWVTWKLRHNRNMTEEERLLWEEMRKEKATVCAKSLFNSVAIGLIVCCLVSEI